MGLHARHRFHSFLIGLSAIVVFVLMAFPLYGVVLTSIQPEAIIRSRDVQFIPRALYFSYYQEIFAPDHIVPIPTAMTNSLLVAAATALVTVTVAMPATYALSRMRLPGKKVMLSALVSIYLLPMLLFVLPLYIFAVQVRLVDTYLVLILLYTAFTLPLTIWALKGFLESVPLEVEEAARLDGCTQLQLFTRIVLPLMRPGILAVLLMIFIMAWVEFLTPLLFTSRLDILTVTLGLYRSTRDIQIGQLAAAAVVTALPVVILTAIFQGMLSKVITAGADR